MNISAQCFAGHCHSMTSRSSEYPQYKFYTDLCPCDWGQGWELRPAARTVKLHRMFVRLINTACGICCVRVEPQKEMAFEGYCGCVIFFHKLQYRSNWRKWSRHGRGQRCLLCFFMLMHRHVQVFVLMLPSIHGPNAFLAKVQKLPEHCSCFSTLFS